MRVNIQNQLLKQRNRRIKEVDILKQVEDVLNEDAQREQRIQEALEGSDNSDSNDFNIDLLETNRIFHLEDIKKICITYRLRFLDSHLFKGQIPLEAISEIKSLEKNHDTTLGGFKLMAPSKLFKLENYDDPLLFAPIGNGYYYLIHKWGNDLNLLRKWLMYPFRNLDTIIISTILASFLITLILPENFYNPEQKTTQFILIWLYAVKIIGFILIYYGVGRGKNFSSAIWDSRYIN